MSSQKAKQKEVAEPEADQPENDAQDDSGSDLSEEDHDQASSTLPEASVSSASIKKKKKKRSKALKALRGSKDGIPQKVVDAVLEKVRAEGGEAASADEATVRMALEHLKIKDVIQGKAGIGGRNRKDTGDHKFWATQPVPQLGEGPPLADGYIEPSIPPEEVRQEAYPLPKDFEWSTLDINDPSQLRELYELLSGHYVEDDDASFRFQYSAEFLQWALMPPGYNKEWHLGVRVASNKKLVAFVSGIPLTLRVRENVFNASEVNFLCVHKKLRSKRLAPVLIKEITRLCHRKGVFQALYTAGVLLPTPISTCRYHHRCLNIHKLVDVRFTHVPSNMTLARMIRLNKVPDRPHLLDPQFGLREMEEKDVPKVAELFAKFMRRFGMVQVMTLDEVRHYLLSGTGEGPRTKDSWSTRREGQVVWTYVVENPETHKITDFFSFYSLPSTIINSEKHNVLQAAYLFYYATDVALHDAAELDGRLKKRLEELIGDCLVTANAAGFDVLNALSLMDNCQFMQDLKFGLGDGMLNYYLYNWRTAPLAGVNAIGDVPAGKGIGVVML
ncbi:Glycylpeptide N-tetradecanoyltransferase [Sparassis crispa]|uniref:Glycylpeptide N-tetradecanoyltransferase n=1 Tax=Sparassis crispa TaxID=139825 RepID=A0A401GIU4_9APHY|nr:Glycylpeptide N-tetradecanoyltransferase [Sparassis crispa]GBE82092.1 Glycylpeptide N-tetradecanoyltransferase [Sparassis crispa]